MNRRQTQRPGNLRLPAIWLLTDPRFGDDLLPAIRRLRFGSGVIFRHYHLDATARRALFQKVRRICRQRGHLLLVAGDDRRDLRRHGDGVHTQNRQAGLGKMIFSTPVHNVGELAAARRGGADLVLISPLFPTASHPGEPILGRHGFSRLAALAGGMRVIALGGMTRSKAAMLDQRIFHGWAAIDAFRR
jgi:thiamine-phosphate pyrophosphorylase